MHNHNWKEFIRKAKIDYYGIKAIVCPTFDDELIHFNHHGWKHIQRKYGKLRKISDQKRRILLLPKAVSILKSIAVKTTHEKVDMEIEFWGLSEIVGNEEMTVVIRRVKNGVKHFFSVLNKKLPHNTKGHKGLL